MSNREKIELSILDRLLVDLSQREASAAFKDIMQIIEPDVSQGYTQTISDVWGWTEEEFKDRFTESFFGQMKGAQNNG